MSLIQISVANTRRSQWIKNSGSEQIFSTLRNRTINQVGRGGALLSAVIGSVFFRLTGATETSSTDLACQVSRRVGAAPLIEE